MELKDFIKNTLTSINEWVNEFNKENNKKYELSWNNKHNQWWVEFDLIVSSEETNSGNWWWKINILWNSVWWELSQESKNINNSRIKFIISKESRITFV